MLVINGVSKKYKDKLIFDNIKISIDKPGVYLLKGKNGVGKTTLLNIIGGFTNYKGKVDNKGNISYLYQNSFLIDYLTIREHFKLFKIDVDLLARFNLKDKLDCLPISLSNGQRQRIAFILAIYSNNDIILLDEPFSNLDEENITIVKKIIKEKKTEKIIIVVTHNGFLNKNEIDGEIKIVDCNLKSNFNGKKIIKIEKNKKRKLSFINYKYRFKYKKGTYIKLYTLLFIAFLIISAFFWGKRTIQLCIDKDISYSVDYNKYYLKSCNKIETGNFNVLKCNNPSQKALSKIDYGYNYDYLLNYLYNREDLSVANNKGVLLKKGRYPESVNEVLANNDYKLNDIITLKSSLIIHDDKSDIYNEKLQVKVVGIYNDLSFYSDKKIYFDYDYLDRYLENQILKNNGISLKQYYINLDINNYKYLSFNKTKSLEIIFEGEKDSFYSSLDEIVVKVIELVNYIKNIIMIFLVYSFYKIYKGIVIDNQKTIAFLLSNSFSKIDIILKEFLIAFIPIIIFLGINLIFGIDGILELSLLSLIAIVTIILINMWFYRRGNIAKLMREELW